LRRASNTETAVPALLPLATSSLIGVSAGLGPMSSTGASFTALTLTFTVTGVDEYALPSETFTVNAAMETPFALLAGVQTTESPAWIRVVPGTTATPPLVSVPETTPSMRKLKVVGPSGSASLAAASNWL